MTINEDALTLLRSLVLHVTTGQPLSDAERQSVRAMAVLMGASLENVKPPLAIEALDAHGSSIECNAEAEMELVQIGTAMWLVSHLIRLSGDVDRRRRRVARDLVEYFETRRGALGLDEDQPILFQYLKHVPHMRASERSGFLGGVWLPALFLQSAPDLDTVALDRLFPTPRSRLTLYKICYWFAAASGRRNAGVIDAIGRIRTELQLDDDPQCIGISAAVTSAMGSMTASLRDPERSLPLASALANRVVAGTVEELGADRNGTPSTAAERLVDLIPEIDRLPALALIFDVAMRETRLSTQSLGCIAHVVDAIDPSEGELTSILLRHELDSGRRIRLPRDYRIDYGKPQVKQRRARM